MADTKTIDADAIEGMDTNGDGHISKAEMEMALEFKRKSLEDQDAQRDAMRKMTVRFDGDVAIPIRNRTNILLRYGRSGKHRR